MNLKTLILRAVTSARGASLQAVVLETEPEGTIRLDRTVLSQRVGFVQENALSWFGVSQTGTLRYAPADFTRATLVWLDRAGKGKASSMNNRTIRRPRLHPLGTASPSGSPATFGFTTFSALPEPGLRSRDSTRRRCGQGMETTWCTAPVAEATLIYTCSPRAVRNRPTASCKRTLSNFLAPSIRMAILDATYMPPIKRGDLKNLCFSKPKAVAVVDGEFYQQLAISPKEVLELLEAGVAVYGSSSMGALRAVELYPYGMIGVGTVFRLFRRQILEGDDEVALAFERNTHRPLSEPLVNTRFALHAACKAGILSSSQEREIIAAIKRVYFPERTVELTIRLAHAVVGEQGAFRLRRFLLANPSNIKQRDGRLLLRRIRREVREVCRTMV